MTDQTDLGLLRAAGVFCHEDAPNYARNLDRAADEIESLRAQLAAAEAERDEVRETHEICHRDAVAAIDRAEHAVAALARVTQLCDEVEAIPRRPRTMAVVVVRDVRAALGAVGTTPEQEQR